MLRKMKKTIPILLVLLMIIGSLPVSAASSSRKPGKPNIKVSLIELNDDSYVYEIEIGKTKNADGFEIYGKESHEEKYKKIYTLKQNGKKKRKYNVRYTQSGTFSLKVRAYNDTEHGMFSKVKTVKVSIDIKKSYDFTNAKVGQIIKFGSYEQDNNLTNGKEPIEWIVLRKSDKHLLLLSKYVLDNLPYNVRQEEVTWETCSLRKWLNGDFYKNSFDKQEKNMISKTTLKNDKNEFYDGENGNDTIDKVFCLSQKDMINIKYFDNSYDNMDLNRRCSPTEYAIAQGAFTYGFSECDGPEYKTNEDQWTCMWWLRTLGDGKSRSGGWTVKDNKMYWITWETTAYEAIKVSGKGSVYNDGSDIDYPSGVRPALYIKLKS